jgi:2,4-dienoyl-CoA reductase (NADPH2)
MEFIKLFEPITINGLTIKNRIVMPAMALFYTSDYTFTDQYKSFYLERARGGVGLMITGPMAIDKVGSTPRIPGLFDDTHIGALRKFTDELHRETDIRIGVQLMHQGRNAPTRETGFTPIAPSAIPSPITRDLPREMTTDDIEQIKTAFAMGARRAREAGFDFVEIIAGGYLIGQFLSPLTNLRTDKYGGTVQNRMRFGLEVITSVRQVLGEDFAMGIRVSGHDFMQGGNTNIESAIFCEEAEKVGVDCINVTGGWHETNVPQTTSDVPSGAFVYLARAIKGKVKVPIFASNRLGDPLVAERVLRSRAADMICWGRPLIADPELPNKVKSGSFKERVPCIGCNQRCLDAIFSGSMVGCVLNPRAGRESDTEIRESEVKKKIIVAGGGPAGMEFALSASQRGHNVILYEKMANLGGQMNLIGQVPGKEEILQAVKSLETRLKQTDVKIELNTYLTPEMITAINPDVLVVASGACPSKLDIPGILQKHVVNAWDVLNGSVSNIGKQIVIVGGGATGCDVALFLANLSIPTAETFAFLVYHGVDDANQLRNLLYDAGRTITVLEMMERFAGDVGISTRWPLMKNLRLMGVELRPKTKVLRITEDAVVVETESGTESIPADMVVIAAGSRPVNDLAQKLRSNIAEMVTIGDAVQPRKITDAIKEGFDAALKV